MSYDNTNTGTLGKNKRKETEKHPDYKGKINVNGVDYWLSGWRRQGTGKNGPYDFISLAIEEAVNRSDEVRQAAQPESKQQEPGPARMPAHRQASSADWDDDIPF